MLTLCLPTILFLVLAVGSILATTAATGNVMAAVASQAITLATMAAVIELLCRYGYRNIAWWVVAFLVVAPIAIMFPLLAILGAILWLIMVRK